MNPSRQQALPVPIKFPFGQATSAPVVSPGGFRSRDRLNKPSCPVAPIDLASSSSSDEGQEDAASEPNRVPGAGLKRRLKPWQKVDKDRKYQAVWFLTHLAMQHYDIDSKAVAICSPCSHKQQKPVKLANKLDSIDKHMKSDTHKAAATAHGTQGLYKPQHNSVATLFEKQVRTGEGICSERGLARTDHL